MHVTCEVYSQYMVFMHVSAEAYGQYMVSLRINGEVYQFLLFLHVTGELFGQYIVFPHMTGEVYCQYNVSLHHDNAIVTTFWYFYQSIMFTAVQTKLWCFSKLQGNVLLQV